MEKRKLISVFVFILFSFLFTGFSAMAAEPGVSDSEVLVGSVCDTTGPLALNGVNITLGARAYFEKINIEGGIYGRKFKLIQETDDYQPGKHVAALRKLIFVDKVFGFTNNIGSSNTVAAMPILEQERVPLLGPQAPVDDLYFPSKRYIFGYYPTYYVHGRLMVEYIVNFLKTKGAKIGLIYQDDHFGHETERGVMEGIKKYPEMRLQVVANLSHKRGATDLSPQVINAMAQKADIVLLSCVQQPLAAILKEAQKLNWKPKFISSMAPDIVNVLELAKEAADGLIFQRSFYTGCEMDMELGKVKEFREMLKKYFPNEEPCSYFGLSGYAIAKIFVEACRRAGKDLTREKWIDSMETLKNFDPGAGIEVTYNPSRRLGCIERAFYQEAVSTGVGKECRLKTISDWIHVR